VSFIFSKTLLMCVHTQLHMPIDICTCTSSNPQSHGKCINILTMKPHNFLECGWAKFEFNNSMKILLKSSFWHASSLPKLIQTKK
jgi:hypothetical protein